MYIKCKFWVIVYLLRYDLKRESGKFEFEFACIKCNLSFKMTKDLKMHMHDGKKTKNCNQRVYSSYSPQDTHADTFGTQICQLQTIQILLHTSWKPQETYANPFKRRNKDFSWTQCDCNCSCTTSFNLKRHNRTFRRKTFQLHTVQILLNNHWSL